MVFIIIFYILSDPLPIEIVNLPKDALKTMKLPDFPARDDSPQHEVSFSSNLFIERSDFAEDPSKVEKGFKRLMVGQSVGLKYVGYVISVKEILKDAKGNVTGLKVEVEQTTAKPKAFIHWVDQATSVPCEVRLYSRLFKSKFPEEVAKDEKDGFIKDVNENSLVVNTIARADQSVKSAKPMSRFQFERHGYFCVDPDVSKEVKSGLVFNRTVELKEDKGKGGA